MKLILLLSSLAIVQADETQDDVIINGVRHQKEILYDNLNAPRSLAVDWTTNDLYFSYKKGENHIVAQLNLNTKELRDIGEHLYSAAVDQETQNVYIGGINGIYNYNATTNKAVLIGRNQSFSTDSNMFFKKVLYFNALPSNFVYTFVNGYFTRFEDLEREADHFVIDSDDLMYYTYRYEFYHEKKGTKYTVLIADVPYIMALNTDKDGNVYACSYYGIYKAIGHSTQFIKILDGKHLHGIAFDKDNNIVYSDETKIIRLKPVTLYNTQ